MDEKALQICNKVHCIVYGVVQHREDPVSCGEGRLACIDVERELNIRMKCIDSVANCFVCDKVSSTYYVLPGKFNVGM